ncbi:MAG TPA: DUF2946 family protein [Steroidobacteraceae bacterium]|nr:DUF2946 family protein [Steroidobacteraceae bacterium]
MLLLLLVVGLRVLVPVGFMPATDGTLSVMICQDGFPPVLQTHQQGPQHGHGDADGDDYCSLTIGFSSAPPPVLGVALALFILCLGVVLTRLPTPLRDRFVRIPQARGPPAPL